MTNFTKRFFVVKAVVALIVGFALSGDCFALEGSARPGKEAPGQDWTAKWFSNL